MQLVHSQLATTNNNMKNLILLTTLLITTTSLFSQQKEQFDYFKANREMIGSGVQAILTCNGLFTSERTIEQVYDKELKYLPQPIGTAKGGDYKIDYERKAVAIGAPGGTPVMRAAFREGIGCVMLAPDQGFEDIPLLPIQELPPLEGDPSKILWPNGDLVKADKKLAKGINKEALDEAIEWSFNRTTPEQTTISLLVVHKGKIIAERYAEGFNHTTKTRTWSTAKSIAATLIGMLVDDGKMALDEPLDIEWLPKQANPDTDPRKNITLRHVLNMSSGLYTVDSRRMEYATGSGLAYWAGASIVNGARNRGLIRAPGTSWDYENYDTILAILAMKNTLGEDYFTFPRKALLDKIGMRNTFLSTDRFGDFVLSSQVYTNARDLARFGLLYLNEGKWEGQQLISKEWIDFVRTPAPATKERGNMYGGQWWLVPDDRTDVPKTAYSTAGNRGQYVVCLLYTSPSPRDQRGSRMPSSA